MRIALKVDVDTFRGTMEGVPALLRLFGTYDVRATFLFSLGPDHSGRALKRVFSPAFLSGLRRAPIVSRSGWKALCYGTLLPGPVIGQRWREVLRAALEAGHEVGIHAYDPVKWKDSAAYRDESWTRREMERAAAAFQDIFGRPAKVHGAAGWQLNPHVLDLEERMGFDYASDTRGKGAFFPVLLGVRSRCPQIPTTLPALDELIGREGVNAGNVHELVFAESQYLPPQGHVYTLRAEVEGMRLLPVMEKLLVMWRGSQADIYPLRTLYESLDLRTLPCHQIGWGEMPGRAGHVAMQGRPVPLTG